MSDFQRFLTVNILKKKDIASYLGVSNAFITQLSQGSRDLPNDKLALILANSDWNTSMFTLDKSPSKSDETPTSFERTLSIIESQQRIIESQQRTIEQLTRKD